MSEDELIQEAHEVSPWAQHRFMMMIGAVIVVSFILVGSSMALYTSSGAAQLDLSRPGYQTVRGKVQPTDKFDTFPSSGELDKQALNDFRTQYAKQSVQVIGVDSFGGDVMSDASLQIDPPAAEPAQ